MTLSASARSGRRLGANMTDEIMEMWNSITKYAPSEVRITEFAHLIAAKEREACVDAAMKAAEKAIDVAIELEREACAKVCESINSLEDYYGERTELACAESIRARGQE